MATNPLRPLAPALLGLALLSTAAPPARAGIPPTLEVAGQFGTDHRNRGGGSDEVVNLRATIRDGVGTPLHSEDHCDVALVGSDGELRLTLGSLLPLDLPFDEPYDVLVEACYDRDGCDGVTDIEECDARDRVDVVVPLVPAAYAHRAAEADGLSSTLTFDGDVSGPFHDLQLHAGVVGSEEIADGSVTPDDLAFDPATQLELSAEAAARMAADAAMQSSVDAEAAARAAADSTLQSNVDAEAAARAEVDATLQLNIDGEGAERRAADATLQSNVDAEAFTRAQVDATLQLNIDGEVAERHAADTTLQSGLDAEAFTRAQVDATLQSNIDGEVAERFAADAALQSSVDAEAAARAAADATLRSDLDVEVAARIAYDEILLNHVVGLRSADATLQSNIDAEAATRAAGDATLEAGLAAEASARSNGDVHSGDVAGPPANLQIVNGAVRSAEVGDDSLGSADLGPGSVGSSEVISSEVQLRVSGTCPAGSSIRTIDASGGVTCEPDDSGTASAPSRSSVSVRVDADTWETHTWSCSNGCLSGGVVQVGTHDTDVRVLENGNDADWVWVSTVFNDGDLLGNGNDVYVRLSVWSLP